MISLWPKLDNLHLLDLARSDCYNSAILLTKILVWSKLRGVDESFEELAETSDQNISGDYCTKKNELGF